jgi:hypothetical protein
VTALRLEVVQLCRVSCDFSTRATGGDFEATFASAEPSPGETTDSSVSNGLREGCFNARWPVPRGVVGIQTGRFLLSRACLIYLQATNRVLNVTSHKCLVLPEYERSCACNYFFF